MAMKCNKCGGVIPDIVLNINKNRNDCSNHLKTEINIPIKKW